MVCTYCPLFPISLLWSTLFRNHEQFVFLAFLLTILIMTNQSLLPVEKGYPARLEVPHDVVSWETTYSDYFQAPVYSDGRSGKVADMLYAAGVEVQSHAELRMLGTLST